MCLLCCAMLHYSLPCCTICILSVKQLETYTHSKPGSVQIQTQMVFKPIWSLTRLPSTGPAWHFQPEVHQGMVLTVHKNWTSWRLSNTTCYIYLSKKNLSTFLRRAADVPSNETFNMCTHTHIKYFFEKSMLAAQSTGTHFQGAKYASLSLPRPR